MFSSVGVFYALLEHILPHECLDYKINPVFDNIFSTTSGSG